MENNMKHIMLDIETMGNKSYSAIVSIGAVKFNIETGETGETFYKNIELQSSLNAGLEINADTLMWWLQQNEEARKKLTENTIPLKEVLEDFTKFSSTDYQIWGNSARFDLGLLQNAYNKLNIPICWDFRKERCVRTLVSFAPEVKENTEFKGIAHDALSDCYNQIKYCSEIYKKLKIK